MVHHKQQLEMERNRALSIVNLTKVCFLVYLTKLMMIRMHLTSQFCDVDDSSFFWRHTMLGLTQGSS